MTGDRMTAGDERGRLSIADDFGRTPPRSTAWVDRRLFVGVAVEVDMVAQRLARPPRRQS